MDYLGESGIGAWSYGTSEQATQLKQMHNFLRVYMARFGVDGKNPFAAFQNGQPPNVLSPGYPWHGFYCGDLDLTGFRKSSSYYRDILWNGGNRVYATVRVPEPEGEKIVAGGWSVYPTLSSWTWPGQEGKPLTVEIYSGAERVRLFLNDKLIGEKPTGREQAFRAEFGVPYSQGTLRAEGVRGERVVAESALQTAGPPVLLKLTADRTVPDADGQDLAFVTVEAEDQNGRLQPNADQEVHFSFEGAGSIAAVGNGDAQSKRSYQDDTYNLFHGRALVVLRTSPKPGQITLHARAEGLNEASLLVESKPATELP